MSTMPTPHEQVLSLVLSFWQGRAVAMATELGLADLLLEGPLHVDELSSRTKVNVSALFRLLRALESIVIFNQVSPRPLCQFGDERVSSEGRARIAVASCSPKPVNRQRALRGM